MMMVNMMDDKTIKALQTPAGRDMEAVKNKAAIIIGLDKNGRMAAYRHVPKCELGFVKTYVTNSDEKNRRINGKKYKSNVRCLCVCATDGCRKKIVVGGLCKKCYNHGYHRRKSIDPNIGKRRHVNVD